MRVTKNTPRIGVSWTPAYLSVFDLFLIWIMTWIKQLSTQLSANIFEAFVLILLNVNFSLNQTLVTFLLNLKQTWMTHWFWQFHCVGLSSFNSKRFYQSYSWSRSLCEKRTSSFMGLVSRKLCRFFLMFSTSFTSLSILLLFPLLITFFVLMHSFWFCFTQHGWGSLNHPIC